MSKTTYPVFGEMLPTSEDIQLIVDSFKEEDRKRLTADGIFNPGIVNEISNYLQEGTQKNTLKILPFIGYTKSGNRIEVEGTWDYLMPQKNGKIILDETLNLVSRTKDVPFWVHYSKNYTNFTEAAGQSFSILIDLLKPGSILQGIKMKHTQAFLGAGDVFVSIGVGEPVKTKEELESNQILNANKFTPDFEISSEPLNEYIETSNIVYSEYNNAYIPVYATFNCTLNSLNNLTSGSLNISLCVTEVSNVEYEKIEFDKGGIHLSNATGYWEPNTTYYVVARYKTKDTDERSINITNDEIDLQTTPFNARQTDDFEFYALRRTGSIVDPLTDDDIKLGKVVSDNQSNILIYINEYDETSKTFCTDYLGFPNIRFTSFIKEVEEKISKKVSKDGDTMVGDLIFNNSGININGTNNYSIKQDENGRLKLFSNNKGLYLKEDNQLPYYNDGKNDYKLLTSGDQNIVNEFVRTYLAGKDIVKETYTAADGSWYRLYISGWVEQGGRINVNKDSSVKVKFLIPFSNKDNYYVNWISMSGWTTGGAGTRAAYPTSETEFTIYNGQDVNMTCNWEAKGYSDLSEQNSEQENQDIQ